VKIYGSPAIVGNFSLKTDYNDPATLKFISFYRFLSYNGPIEILVNFFGESLPSEAIEMLPCVSLENEREI